MDNIMQVYAKNRKSYSLTHEDVEDKKQPASLLSLILGHELRTKGLRYSPLYSRGLDPGEFPLE